MRPSRLLHPGYSFLWILALICAGCAAQNTLRRAPNHVFIESLSPDAEVQAARELKRRGYLPVKQREAAALVLSVEIMEGQLFSCVQITDQEYPHVRSARLKLTDLDGHQKWVSQASRKEHTQRAAVQGAVRDAARAPDRFIFEIILAPIDALLQIKRATRLPAYQSSIT